MTNSRKLIPIYTTSGDVGAFLLYPYIFSRQGEWIGFVEPNRRVYSVHGHYVGDITSDPRIIRKREWSISQPRRTPPAPPPKIRPPARIPLAPQMSELSLSMIDVLDEAPEMLPPIDFGDLRDDMD